MSEFRTAFRYRTHRPALIVLDGGGKIECLVRDLSTKGARLEVAGSEKIPSDFFLLIRGQSDRFRCHLVWQSEGFIGVQYV
jgi:hypothetical protein